MSSGISSSSISDAPLSTNQIAVPSALPQLLEIPMSDGGQVLEPPLQQFYPMSAFSMPQETSVLGICHPQIETHYTSNTNPSSENLQIVSSSSDPPTLASCRGGHNLCGPCRQSGIFTHSQVHEMMCVFQRQPYISRLECMELALRIGASPQQVSIRLTIITAF